MQIQGPHVVLTLLDFSMHLTWTTMLFETLLTSVTLPILLLLMFHYSSSLCPGTLLSIILEFLVPTLYIVFLGSKLILIISTLTSKSFPNFYLQRNDFSPESHIHCPLGGSTSILNFEATSQHFLFKSAVTLTPAIQGDGIGMNQFPS